MAVARIEIIQWREYGDDDDSLSILVRPADDDSDACEGIAEDHGLNYPNDGDKAGDLLVIDRELIDDGELVTGLNGKQYRIAITEVATC